MRPASLAIRLPHDVSTVRFARSTSPGSTAGAQASSRSAVCGYRDLRRVERHRRCAIDRKPRGPSSRRHPQTVAGSRYSRGSRVKAACLKSALPNRSHQRPFSHSSARANPIRPSPTPPERRLDGRAREANNRTIFSMRSCAPRCIIWPTIPSNPEPNPCDRFLFSARTLLLQRPP